MNQPNPYAPPNAHVQDIQADKLAIDSLPVSPKWKLRFHLLDKAGGPGLSNFKQLTFGQRMKVSFNLLAFLFGPIYYAIKGMWKKGLVLFALVAVVVIALSLVLELMGLGHLGNGLSVAAGAVYATRANIDYYKKMVLNDNSWW